MTFQRSGHPLCFWVLFGVQKYAHLHERNLDVQGFPSIRLDGERNLVYDSRYGVDRLSAAGGWDRCWMHLGGRGAVLWCAKATYVHMRFIR